MISFGVIVRDVLANSCSKRIFAKEDHSFQAVFLDRPDKPFRIGIQVGRSWWKLHRVDSGLVEEADKILRVERIAVINQISILLQETILAIGDVASDLSHSESIWASRDSAELYSSRRQLNEEEDQVLSRHRQIHLETFADGKPVLNSLGMGPKWAQNFGKHR